MFSTQPKITWLKGALTGHSYFSSDRVHIIVYDFTSSPPQFYVPIRPVMLWFGLAWFGFMAYQSL